MDMQKDDRLELDLTFTLLITLAGDQTSHDWFLKLLPTKESSEFCLGESHG